MGGDRDAASELDAIVRHSAASNGFGAPEVAAPEIEPPEASPWFETVQFARDELLWIAEPLL